MDQILTSNKTQTSQSGNFHNKPLNYFSAKKNSKRISRRFYFVFAILMPFIALWMLAKIATQLTQSDIITHLFISWILALIAISVIAMVVRLTIYRCHDLGINRWFAALALIPFSPLIFVLLPEKRLDKYFTDKPEVSVSFIKETFFLFLIKLNDRLKY